LRLARCGGARSRASASCHRKVYEKYRVRGVGLRKNSSRASCTRETSGVRYQLMEKGGKVWLRYERETKDPDRELNGRQELIFHWFGEAAGPISSSNTGIGLSCRLTGTARRRSGTWRRRPASGSALSRNQCKKKSSRYSGHRGG